MAKRKKKKGVTHTYIKIAASLIALILLAWFGIGFYQEVKLNNASPMHEPLENEPSIGQIIQPLVEYDDTITLIFEDELPEPISSQPSEPTSHEKRHQIALIIDDVGYDMKSLRRLLALPFPITVAILPDAPYAKRAAELAHQRGIPVMLHMPMQTTNLKYAAKMEDFYLHSAMSKSIFTQVFESALAKVPHVVGINNHMGSALTSDKKSMQWLMELCEKHGLFFIDSRTSSTSVAAETAAVQGIAWNRRDIFLDHIIEAEAIEHAWQSALSCASRNDTCVMLAHPHQETVSFLEQNIASEDFAKFTLINKTLKD